MVDVNLLGLDTVTNGTVIEVDVVHALGAGAFGLVHSHLVVVVQTHGDVRVGESHVTAAVTKR